MSFAVIGFWEMILLVPIIGLGVLVYVLYSGRNRKGERMVPATEGTSGQSQGSGECSECGGKVSNRLNSCPHCGSPVEPQQSQISQQVSPGPADAMLSGIEIQERRKGETQMNDSSGQWIVRLPGQPEDAVNTVTLQMWARSGVIKPDSLIEEVATGHTYSATQIPRVFSDKSFVTTIVLSVLVGSLGVDRFYLGYIGLGILKLLTLGACGIWSLVDLILIAMRKIPDADGRPLG